ncbi:MAG: hypothetical protein HQK83_00775 [Fibrobacteria bacterium]|nr:hypothetical protein [Fibrobacteria bacterium]
MDISRLSIGILHSLIGKNDGVSIVIDQTIEAMIHIMNIPLGNIHLLAAHCPPRFNTTTDEIFWHKSDQNKYILENYSDEAPLDLDSFILEEAKKAKKLMSNFVENNDLDLFIIHNSCHPSNFVYAVAAGMYFEELQKEGRATPKYLLWWHDSHFERERFMRPNAVIKKYLQYVPGRHVNGVVFINTEQEKLAQRRYFTEVGMKNPELFFERKTKVIPNTCDIPWEWKELKTDILRPIAPKEDQYNKTFFRDIGLEHLLEQKGRRFEDTIILLQHTRIVQRKRIDHSIDFAIKMEKKFRAEGHKKFFVILVSGHSGDEHDAHRMFLQQYFNDMMKSNRRSKENIALIFAEEKILPEKEVIVEKKFYKFADIPGIIARSGGMGTYFSEVEGFGNNLLEMISLGLPAVINKYPIYKSDIEPLGFKLPATEGGALPDELIQECYELLVDMPKRNALVKHNLKVLHKNLHHGIIADRLSVLIQNMFKYT